jgi:ketosteroid isomerase-like protein
MRVAVGLLSVSTALAQTTTYTKADVDEIQGLSAKYASALGTCQAEAYAALFTPDGIFYSSFRGTIQGTAALVALVKSERHCQPGAERPTRPGGGAGAPALQFGNIVYGARTAKMTVTLPDNGGNYEDAYAKTAAGWRFANRSHYPPAEVAARASGKPSLSAEDVLDIRQLVARYAYMLDTGADGGKAWADLFTNDGVFTSPQTTLTGREALLKFASGHRPGQGPANVRNFTTNVRVEPTPDGNAKGRVYAVTIAIGENNDASSVFAGGHFEDVYARTPAGWRFKRRQFVPSEGGPTSNVGKPTR